MIDYELIETSKEYTKNIINNAVPCASGLYILENILYPPFLTKLYNYVSTTENLPWTIVSLYETECREKISFFPESVIEEAHLLMEDITTCISQKLDLNLKLIGIDIWKDKEGFYINKHTDNPVINASLQVYLNHYSNIDYSTKFNLNGTVVSPKNLTNHGYLIDQRTQISHWMKTKVTSNFERYSIHAIWEEVKSDHH